jgi:putative aminopeptidase FrvX
MSVPVRDWMEVETVDSTTTLLQDLSQAPGPPGLEDAVRTLLYERLEGLGELSSDPIGNVLCVKQGSSERPRVALVAHMDEVGFLVRQVTDNGLIRFAPLGGWWSQVLLGQRVTILTAEGAVQGVIGAGAPHEFLIQEIDLIVSEEALKVVRLQQMTIDVGALNADQVRALGIRVGDPIIPASGFEVLADGAAYLGKAWDDRCGCALLVDIMSRLQKEDHPNTAVAVATVQEELGTRGAQAVVEKAAPDVAVIVECALAEESWLPGTPPPQVRMGRGPAVYVLDLMMMPNIKLRRWVERVAEDAGIALQHCATEGGGSDGGPIHLHSGGVPTLTIGVPMRYAHSWAGIIRRDDYDMALKLLLAILSRLDADAVSLFRA